MNWHLFMSIVEKVVPIVVPVIPGGKIIAPITSRVIHAIGEAEKMKNDIGRKVTGAEKRAHMQNIVQDAAEISTLVAPDHPVSPDATREIAGQIADTTCAIVKVIEAAQNNPKVPVETVDVGEPDVPVEPSVSSAPPLLPGAPTTTVLSEGPEQ